MSQFLVFSVLAVTFDFQNLSFIPAYLKTYLVDMLGQFWFFSIPSLRLWFYSRSRATRGSSVSTLQLHTCARTCRCILHMSACIVLQWGATVFTCAFTCANVYHICVHVWVNVHLHVHTHMHMHICVHICLQMYMVPKFWHNALPTSLETMEVAGCSKILVPLYHVPEDSNSYV